MAACSSSTNTCPLCLIDPATVEVEVSPTFNRICHVCNPILFTYDTYSSEFQRHSYSVAGAQYLIGLYHHRLCQLGEFYTADAERYYRLSAEKNYPLARLNLGLLLLDHNPHRVQEAIDHIKAAAKFGCAEAQFQIGIIYLTNELVTRDDSTALHYLRHAADQVHTEACVTLGDYYYNAGRYTEALTYYKKAAVNCDIDAQFNAGVIYHSGLLGEKNYAEARLHYEVAARQNHPQAQFNLALIYLEGGPGVERNIEKGHELLLEAAAQGHELSRTLLDKIGSLFPRPSNPFCALM